MLTAWAGAELCRYAVWAWCEKTEEGKKSGTYWRWSAQNIRGQLSVVCGGIMAAIADLAGKNPEEWALYFLLLSIVFWDIRFCWIPESCLRLCIGIGLLHWLYIGMPLSSIGALALGTGVLGGLRSLSGGQLGEGDIWLIAGISGWCTMGEMAFLLWLAFFLGGIAAMGLWCFGYRRLEIPFTPFLCMAFYLLSLKEVLEWYLQWE